MKKGIIAYIFAAVLCLSLTGCVKSVSSLSEVPTKATATTAENTAATTVATTVATTTTTATTTTITKKPTQKQAMKTTVENVVVPKITTASKKNATVAPEKTRPVSNADKQFLKDYENWVDRYLVLADKMVANPENPDLANEFYGMIQETGTWGARLEEISEALEEGSEQTKQFEAEVMRITKKLEDGVNRILATTTVAPTTPPTTVITTTDTATAI